MEEIQRATDVKKMSFCQYFGFINLLQDKLAIIMDNYQLTEKYQYQKEISKQNKQQLKNTRGFFFATPWCQFPVFLQTFALA